jgi:hypothetical protein
MQTINLRDDRPYYVKNNYNLPSFINIYSSIQPTYDIHSINEDDKGIWVIHIWCKINGRSFNDPLINTNINLDKEKFYECFNKMKLSFKDENLYKITKGIEFDKKKECDVYSIQIQFNIFISSNRYHDTVRYYDIIHFSEQGKKYCEILKSIYI